MNGRPDVNVFRKRRGRILRQWLDTLRARAGRDLHVLDVGGRESYWQNVGTEGIARISLLNIETDDLAVSSSIFQPLKGDARRHDAISGQSFDFVHSNSVIEHVGSWDDMQAMAGVLRAAAPAGWVQTPAWEFPFEPHYRLPLMHYFAAPVRRAMLRLSPVMRRGVTLSERRHHADRINLLSRAEIETLFPDAVLTVERVALLPKSYVVCWGKR